MLKINSICCNGMFSFGFMPVINLDGRGLVFIQGINEDDGGSNGASKSSFINAIKEILYAQNDTGKSKDNVINKHESWDNGYFGILWLEDRTGIEWRIIVARKWKWNKSFNDKFGLSAPGSTHSFNSEAAKSSVRENGDQYEGTDIFLERWDGNSYTWIDERPTSMKNKSFEDTQKKIIEDIVCMTYDQFSAYVCLGQKAESALVIGTSGAREKIIQSVADVTVWTKAAEIVKSTQASREIDLNNTQNKLVGVQSAYNMMGNNEQQVAQVRKQISAAKFTLDNHETRLIAANSNLVKLNTQIAADDVSGIQDEIDLLIAEERHSVERLQKIESPERPEELISLEEEVGKLRYEIMITSSSIKNFKKLGTGECSHCGQIITGRYVKDEVKALKQELKSNESVKTTKDAGLINLRNEYYNQIETAKQAAIDKYNHEVGLIAKSKKILTDKKQTYDQLRMEIANVENEYKNFQYAQQVEKRRIVDLGNSLQLLLNEDTKKQQIEAEIANLQGQINTIGDEIKHLKWTEKNLKKLRIQEYNLVIDRLNILLAEELYDLWGPRMQVRFVTASSKTRGKGVKQGLDLIVTTPKKAGIPIEMYSGGETKAIVVAMFKAMIRLSVERDMAVNISAIDEIDKDLDDEKTDKLVEAYQSIVNESSTCFVISHNSRLVNTLRPNETWIVRKRDEMATIEIPNPHQVAA